jgi:hypothetical protein
MPVKGQQGTKDEALHLSLGRAADRAATAAVERNTGLRGDDAERVARHALHAARRQLEASYAARLLGTSQREAVTLASSAVAMLVLHLVVAGSVLRRGGPVGRAAAGAAAIGHLGFFWYAQARERKIRNVLAVKAQP